MGILGHPADIVGDRLLQLFPQRTDQRLVTVEKGTEGLRPATQGLVRRMKPGRVEFPKLVGQRLVERLHVREPGRRVDGIDPRDRLEVRKRSLARIPHQPQRRREHGQHALVQRRLRKASLAGMQRLIVLPRLEKGLDTVAGKQHVPRGTLDGACMVFKRAWQVPQDAMGPRANVFSLCGVAVFGPDGFQNTQRILGFLHPQHFVGKGSPDRAVLRNGGHGLREGLQVALASPGLPQQLVQDAVRIDI